MQLQPIKNRVSSYRSRLRASGLKQVQLWVPNSKVPGFASECQRQSLIIQNDMKEMDDFKMLADIADWNEE